MSNEGSSNEYAERFRIYDDQLSKFEQLRDELNAKDQLILDLQAVVNSNTNHLQTNNTHSPVTPVSIIIFILNHESQSKIIDSD